MKKDDKSIRKAKDDNQLLENIKKTQERLIVSLAAAWESAPDDPEIREQLMKATEKAVDLREKVYKQVLNEEPPDVRKSYEKIHKKLEEEIKRRDSIK